MAIERARAHLAGFGLHDQIRVLAESSATVTLAAAALGTQPERIAKTLSFLLNGEPILVVAAGDAKVANGLFKAQFGVKPRMISSDAVEEAVGHAVGGVCPFGVNPGVRIYLDTSLQRFTTVFPACGSANSAIELTIPQLVTVCGDPTWVSVCTVPADPAAAG
ncbi:MAG: YbaK/EbsC family protein [Austwickia sp.]|nr:YbaK/EbsC family protein [Austwickia sp.]MBK9101180.1 YbaK/EbsC family protein [Austwickia sp.]